MKSSAWTGVAAAMGAALLFGASVPLAKPLLAHTSPWMLAALLYLGSGVGLAVLRVLRRQALQALQGTEWRWLAGAIVAGGMLGPVLLMLGLANMPAAHASLLLNAEGVLTALLAWVVFRENVDRHVALGMLVIVVGGLVLAWPAGGRSTLASETAALGLWPALAVIGACLAWAVDNNLTRKVSLSDASQIAMLKGLVAGATNLVIALALGATWPAAPLVGAAGLLGFFCYGASLTLFVVALRHLGTARTGAYFSVAPFLGAVLAVTWLGEPVTWPMALAGGLMAIGVALHLAERHEHPHTHTPQRHTHAHRHDDGHHDHPHGAGEAGTGWHTHSHQHATLTHAHAHFPDAHHRHTH